MRIRFARIITIVLVCAAVISGAAYALVIENSTHHLADKPVNVIPLNRENALIVDKMSQSDINNLKELIIDGEGNFVENYQQLRQKYVYEMDKIRLLGQEGSFDNAAFSPFTVILHSNGEGEFEYTFYSVSLEGKTLVIPSEWDVMSFQFLYCIEFNEYFACTDTGVYSIDALSQSAKLISNESYNGVSYADLSIKYSESGGWYLSWIANPILSSDGQWIVYQSNRGDADSLPSSKESLWVLNTITGEEKIIINSNEFSQVPQGFLSNSTLLIANVDGKEDSSIKFSVVDITTGHTTPLELGQLPNVYIDDVSSTGLVAMQLYDNMGIRELFIEITNNGKVSEIFEISGRLQYVQFSPDNSKVAAVLREESDEVIDTIQVYDTANGCVTTSISIAKGSYASALSWVNNGQLIVTENCASIDRNNEVSWLYTLEGEK